MKMKMNGYAIYCNNGFWLGENLKWWKDVRFSKRFGFATTALAYAICELGLDLDSFTIEEVR